MKIFSPKSYFDSVAIKYNKSSQAFPWCLSRKIESYFVKKVLAKCDLENVLELGCGSGFYTRILFELGVDKLTVVDLSLEMLNQIEESPIIKIQSDFTHYHPDKRFSTIVCIGALEFCDDPIKAIQDKLHNLNSKGGFVFMVPKRSFLSRFYQNYHARHGLDIKLFDVKVFKEALGLNFRITELQSVPPFSLIIKIESRL